MAEEKKIILTNDGLKKLEEELENLKVVRRKEVAAKIKEARMQGDLSENAEYDAAKEEQAEIETRITYTLVGPAEADPMQGKLSNESPLGMAMLGHSVGDIIENQAPDGVIEFKILDIK